MSTGRDGFQLMIGLSTGGTRAKVEWCKPDRVGFKHMCGSRGEGFLSDEFLGGGDKVE